MTPGYYVGYKFHVSSTFDEKGRERPQKLHQNRFSKRSERDWCVELDDGELVEVLKIVDSALIVFVQGNEMVGYLG